MTEVRIKETNAVSGDDTNNKEDDADTFDVMFQASFEPEKLIQCLLSYTRASRKEILFKTSGQRLQALAADIRYGSHMTDETTARFIVHLLAEAPIHTLDSTTERLFLVFWAIFARLDTLSPQPPTATLQLLTDPYTVAHITCLFGQHGRLRVQMDRELKEIAAHAERNLVDAYTDTQNTNDSDKSDGGIPSLCSFDEVEHASAKDSYFSVVTKEYHTKMRALSVGASAEHTAQKATLCFQKNENENENESGMPPLCSDTTFATFKDVSTNTAPPSRYIGKQTQRVLLAAMKDYYIAARELGIGVNNAQISLGEKLLQLLEYESEGEGECDVSSLHSEGECDIPSLHNEDSVDMFTDMACFGECEDEPTRTGCFTTQGMSWSDRQLVRSGLSSLPINAMVSNDSCAQDDSSQDDGSESALSIHVRAACKHAKVRTLPRCLNTVRTKNSMRIFPNARPELVGSVSLSDYGGCFPEENACTVVTKTQPHWMTKEKAVELARILFDGNARRRTLSNASHEGTKEGEKTMTMDENKGDSTFLNNTGPKSVYAGNAVMFNRPVTKSRNSQIATYQELPSYFINGTANSHKKTGDTTQKDEVDEKENEKDEEEEDKDCVFVSIPLTHEDCI